MDSIEAQGRIEDALRNAGWYAGRRVDARQVSRWRDVLHASGYDVSERVVALISEFGGLHLRPPPGIPSRYLPHLILDPERGDWPDVLEDWGETIGERLVPLGVVCDRPEYADIVYTADNPLVISTSGHFWWIFDDTADYLGKSSFRQALATALFVLKHPFLRSDGVWLNTDRQAISRPY